MQQQQCTKCSEIKDISEFSIHTRKSNNPLKRGSTISKSNAKAEEDIVHRKECKKCSAARAKAFRERHKALTGCSDYRGSGKTTKYPKEDRELLTAIRSRLTQTKGNAKRKNIVCNLDDDYLYRLFKEQEGICALSGVPMQIEGNTNLRLSLDKKIPEYGYIEGNVQWTIFAANRAKGDLSTEDFTHLCKLIVERATTIETASKDGRE